MNALAIQRSLFLLLAIWLSSGGVLSAQQLTPDEQANQLLDAARRAFNEGNQPFAADRFRQYLTQFAGHKDAHHARLGLGMALIEARPPDFQQAIEPLKPAAEAADFSERALANYYLATAYRGVGQAALVLAAQKPNEAPQHQKTASANFDLAAKAFEIAAKAFLPRLQIPMATAADLKTDFDWIARAQLDLVEMQYRLGKTKEGLAIVEALLAQPPLASSKYLNLAKYYLGYGRHQIGEHLLAAKVLAQLAPFDDPVFGPHARYLLGRTHHLLEQRAEAQLHYDAIVAAFGVEFANAKQVAANAELLKNNPAERARLTVVASTPPPDYVARAWFYSAVLAYEQERFGEALDKFTQSAVYYKTSSLASEALLRKGFCQVRLKQFPEATATLTPLQDDAQLGFQARWWLGRAQVGLAGVNPPAAAQHLNGATDHFRKAADRASQLTPQLPIAKLNRQDILLELGEAYQSNKQFNEAVATLQQVLNETPAVDRAELAAQRLTTALHLAGKVKESDDACVRFAQTYPQSLLLPSVLFRATENALAAAEAAYADPKLPNREAALKPLYTEVITRSTKFLPAYPEFVDINLVRHGLGLAHYRLGDFEKAAGVFKQIPAADRTGDTLTTSYFLADCLLRTSPEVAEDALAGGQLLDASGEAVKLLEAFVASSPPTSPQIPDALVKLGDAQLRIAGALGNEPERVKSLQLARQAYERVTQQFPQHPVAPVAIYERARCLIAQKDVGAALNEYRRFLQDPLKNAPIAPMAVLRLATMLRADKKPQEALDPLAQTRQQHEAALLADPTRAAWAPLLQYHHAVALKEANKVPEAQALFENLMQRFPTSPESHDAAWRVQQCKRELVLAKLEPAKLVLLRPDAKPNELQDARNVIADAISQFTKFSQALEQHAASLNTTAKGSEAQLSTLYEQAWCQRLLGEFEVAAAREKLREEARKKRQEELVKLTPPGRTPAKAPLPDMPLTFVPLQPAELKARAVYTSLIQQGGEKRLVPIAKLELAEVHSLREEFPAAITLLQSALQGELPEELTARMRVRLAAALIAKGQAVEAQSEVQALATSDKAPNWGEAKYLAGEALIAQKQWPAAIEMLKAFRDDSKLHNLAGISDRAMLRLAFAYEQAGQWEPARQAYEAAFNRYVQSPWRVEARYGMAWCHQRQNQWDQAVNHYHQVVKSTNAEVAARSQYQMGVCRQAQQRWQEAADAYQLCAYTYDYPELNAQSLVDAASALAQLKKTPDAAKLLAQVGKEYAATKAAPIAAEQLLKLPPSP